MGSMDDTYTQPLSANAAAVSLLWAEITQNLPYLTEEQHDRFTPAVADLYTAMLNLAGGVAAATYEARWDADLVG